MGKESRVKGRVCPWWCAYTFDNAFRRLFHNPDNILGPYVKHGMTVLDVGCGMGYFSLWMARAVGDEGMVIAADLQQEMLEVTMRRARRAGVASRIRPHLCASDRIGVEGRVNFALASWMVHEVPDVEQFLREIHAIVKPGGTFLMTEPTLHVSWKTFTGEVETACEVGFRPMDSTAPLVRFSWARAFRREGA